MTEAFLYHIWQYKLFNFANIVINNLPLTIIKTGTRNLQSGPDFFNARIKIGDTIWAGNVEIHVKTSDWFLHGHDTDDAYNNTILHVVFNNDLDNQKVSKIPVLELKNYIPDKVLAKIGILEKSNNWIPCQELFPNKNNQIFYSWLERLSIDRLEQKTLIVKQKLIECNHDFEWLIWHQIFQYYGFKVNAVPMELLIQSIPKKILLKHQYNINELEAIFFGVSGLLPEKSTEPYVNELIHNFSHFKNLYKLDTLNKSVWKFGGLRPQNFPTIRISQLANLIHHSLPLFEKCLQTQNHKSLCKIFETQASTYWNNHFVFNKTTTKNTVKKLGSNSLNALLINVLAPIFFLWDEMHNKSDFFERSSKLLNFLPPEENSIIKKWQKLGVETKNAFQTQALLQLKSQFCNHKQCLNCAVGIDLIKGV